MKLYTKECTVYLNLNDVTTVKFMLQAVFGFFRSTFQQILLAYIIYNSCHQNKLTWQKKEEIVMERV